MRKDAEKEGRARKKRAAGAKGKVKAPNSVERQRQVLLILRKRISC